MKKRTKYDDVYIDDNGVIFYQIESHSEGKRIRKKSKVGSDGKPFLSAFQAHKEVTRLKGEMNKRRSNDHL